MKNIFIAFGSCLTLVACVQEAPQRNAVAGSDVDLGTNENGIVIEQIRLSDGTDLNLSDITDTSDEQIVESAGT